MKYLFETLKLDPFDTFYKTLKDMTKDGPLSKHQFPELTKLLYESLSSIVPNQDELLYIRTINTIASWFTYKRWSHKSWDTAIIFKPIAMMVSVYM